ncbi:hypothetical protein BBJ28_00023807 [Nothophytophthora sp. Chile5]|nr:hypothetical protein BBJ28_00023807 [Nothophytophthora sp. Chile5]
MDTSDSFVRLLKGTTDFRVWRARVENELMRSHLLGYVLVRGYDGSQTFTYSGEELPLRDGLGQWTVLAERAETKNILKWSLHPDMESIILHKDVYESWIMLCAVYADRDDFNAYETHRTLRRMRLGDKEGESPHEFITRWEVTLQQYALIMGIPLTDAFRSVMLVQTPPCAWLSVVSTWQGRKSFVPYTELMGKVIAECDRAQVQGIERDSRKLVLTSLAEPTRGEVKVNNPTALSRILAGNEDHSGAAFEEDDAFPSTPTRLLRTLLRCLESTQPKCTGSSAPEASVSAYGPRFVFLQLELMLELRSQVPVVSEWLAVHHEEWKWLYEWLRLESLQPSLGGRLPLLKREPGKLETLCQLGQTLGVPYQKEQRRYLVEGAGYAPVNGVYVSTTLVHNDCLTYACRKGDMEYTLYRCCMASKARRWYISYVPNKLGTRSDEDFYYVKSDVDEEVPPADGWQSCVKNVKAKKPVPVVSLYSSTVTEMDGEDDDGVQAAGGEASGLGVSVVSTPEMAAESDEAERLDGEDDCSRTDESIS